MESGSSRWFRGSFVDTAYLNDWAKTNINNISTRTLCFTTTSTKSSQLETKTEFAMQLVRQQQQQQNSAKTKSAMEDAQQQGEEEEDEEKQEIEVLQSASKKPRKPKKRTFETILSTATSPPPEITPIPKGKRNYTQREKRSAEKRQKPGKSQKRAYVEPVQGSQTDENEEDATSDENTEDEKTQEPIPQKPGRKAKPTIPIIADGPLTREKEWWFSGAWATKVPPFAVVAPSSLGKCEVKFQGKRILYFKTFHYLKRMPDGAAVGNATMCKRVSKNPKNTMPPFLTRSGCDTEQECVQQAIVAFTHIWFHVYFQTTTEECENLLLWKDLVEANQTSLVHLQQMVQTLFDAIAGPNVMLAAFFRLVLKRVLAK